MTSDKETGGGAAAGGPARPRDRRATYRAEIEIPAVLRPYMGGKEELGSGVA